jgi:hypothetical protein
MGRRRRWEWIFGIERTDGKLVELTDPRRA